MQPLGIAQRTRPGGRDYSPPMLHIVTISRVLARVPMRARKIVVTVATEADGPCMIRQVPLEWAQRYRTLIAVKQSHTISTHTTARNCFWWLVQRPSAQPVLHKAIVFNNNSADRVQGKSYGGHMERSASLPCGREPRPIGQDMQDGLPCLLVPQHESHQ